MKPHQVTIILLCILVALIVACWGRFLEWFEDLTPIWKTAVFMFAWALLILIGYRQGEYWMLSAVIAGPLAIVLIVFFYADRILDEPEK